MDKVAIVTGASQGIGAQTVRTLAANGYRVALHYNKHRQAAMDLQDELRAEGADVFAVQTDLSNSTQAEALFDVVLKKYKRVDLLVNNAGIAHYGLLIDTPMDTVRKIVDTDLMSVLYCCKLAAQTMLSAHSGVIVNVSSIWGQVGGSCESVYSAAKGGVIALTKALAKELGYNGIRVNAIAPGVIDTAMIANLSDEDKKDLIDQTPCGRLGTPRDVAECILWLASENASFINGQIIGVNGGMCIV